jgi:hypothetical protein
MELTGQQLPVILLLRNVSNDFQGNESGQK